MNISANKSKKFMTAVTVLTAMVLMLSCSGCVARVKVNIDSLGPEKKGSIELDKSKVTDKLNVNVDLAIAAFSIKKGNTFCINYNVPEKMIPDAVLSDNVLTIDGQDDVRSTNLGVGKVGDLWSCGKEGSNSFKIELVIPSDMEIEDINYVVNLGAVKLDGISFDDMAGVVNLGDLQVLNVTCDDMENVIGLGSVTVNKVTCGICKSNINLGDLNVKEITCDEVYAIVNMGDIKISGDFPKVTANCSMGSVSVDTKRPEKDVTINVSVNMGSKVINGK